MRRFYDGVQDLDSVTVYGDFSRSERAAVVALNIRDYDSAEVADALFADYDIATRAGAHCAPRMHEALGHRAAGRGALQLFVFQHGKRGRYRDCRRAELAE